MSGGRDIAPVVQAQANAWWALAKAGAWSRRDARERNALALAAAVLAAAVAWNVAWLPAQSYLHHAQYRYEQDTLVLASLGQARHEATAVGLSRPTSLSAVLTDTAQAAGVSINTLSTESPGRMQLQSASVSFDAAVLWLHMLETTHHLTIDDLQMTKTGEGLVQLRLVVTGHDND